MSKLSAINKVINNIKKDRIMKKDIIPKEFYLLGQKIKVVQKPLLIVDKNLVGQSHYGINEIHLQTKEKNNCILTEEKQGQVFYHELVHQIIDKMGLAMKENIVLDEKFVDLFGGLLHQFEITKK